MVETFQKTGLGALTPKQAFFKGKLEQCLATANIPLNNGSAAPYSMQVHDPSLYTNLFSPWLSKSLVLGDGYVNELWSCDDLPEFFRRLWRVLSGHQPFDVITVWNVIKACAVNQQSLGRSQRVATYHYNLGNEFFEAILGGCNAFMQYTCAKRKLGNRVANNLNEAQLFKLCDTAENLELQPEMKVLEWGGGWGGLALYLATRHNCQILSYNISKNQVDFARKWCCDLPVAIVNADYRECQNLQTQFDRFVSVGMWEHVGRRNYRRAAKLVHKMLKPGGRAFIHSIVWNTSGWPGQVDPWLNQNIFAGGELPSEAQLHRSFEGLLVHDQTERIDLDYAWTLKEWRRRFHESWPRFKNEFEEQFGVGFFLAFDYYLAQCQGCFEAQAIGLARMSFAKLK